MEKMRNKMENKDEKIKMDQYSIEKCNSEK